MNPNLPTGETLSEGSPMPPMPTENEFPVKLEMLAQPDDQDHMQSPSAGDSGSATVDYTVTRIEGELAFIKINAINGESVENPTEPDMAEEGAGLRNEAETMTP